MHQDQATPQPSAPTWLVWCMGRPNLNRTHASLAAAQRDAATLAGAFPNHRFDVFQLVSSHVVDVPYGATRGTPAPPRRPLGTQDY